MSEKLSQLIYLIYLISGHELLSVELSFCWKVFFWRSLKASFILYVFLHITSKFAAAVKLNYLTKNVGDSFYKVRILKIFCGEASKTTLKPGITTNLFHPILSLCATKCPFRCLNLALSNPSWSTIFRSHWLTLFWEMEMLLIKQKHNIFESVR